MRKHLLIISKFYTYSDILIRYHSNCVSVYSAEIFFSRKPFQEGYASECLWDVIITLQRMIHIHLHIENDTSSHRKWYTQCTDKSLHRASCRLCGSARFSNVRFKTIFHSIIHDLIRSFLTNIFPLIRLHQSLFFQCTFSLMKFCLHSVSSESRDFQCVDSTCMEWCN